MYMGLTVSKIVESLILWSTDIRPSYERFCLEIMSFEQALLKDSLLVFRGLDRIEVHFSSPLGLVSLVTTAVSS